jgi:hypothetical protein
MNEFSVQLKNGKTVGLDMNIFEIDKEKGMVNLTKIGKACEKLVGNWLKSTATKEYLQAFKDFNPDIPNGITTIQGGSEGQGTWGHPKIAIRFAQWISPSFAVWCDSALNTLFQEGSVSIQKPALPQTFAEALRLAADQQELIEEQTKQLDHKSEVITALVDNVDVYTMRTVLNRVCKNTKDYSQIQARYNELYRVFTEVHHVNLKARREGYNLKQNKKKNQLSVIAYAEKFGYLKDLYEVSVKLFETDVKKILNEINASSEGS